MDIYRRKRSLGVCLVVIFVLLTTTFYLVSYQKTVGGTLSHLNVPSKLRKFSNNILQNLAKSQQTTKTRLARPRANVPLNPPTVVRATPKMLIFTENIQTPTTERPTFYRNQNEPDDSTRSPTNTTGNPNTVKDVGKKLEINRHTTKRPRIDQSPPVNTTPILLIVAYLRTGSTFTASLFTQSSQSFYVFEPLHVLFNLSQSSKAILYLNGTIRRFQTIPRHVVAETLQHWFHCSFSHIDMASLMDPFHYDYSRLSMRPFYICVKHKLSRNPSRPYAIRDCLPEAERRCHSGKMKVFKTIRTTLDVVEKLITWNPSMKVIHLVRDPRGMFSSQTVTFKQRNTLDVVKDYCDRIVSDLEISKRIHQTHAGQIKLVRYEDIAFQPLNAAKDLYKFVGMTFGYEVQRYVNQSTSSNQNDTCPYCTKRGNSTKTAVKWRNTIRPLLLESINKHCQPLFADLGYVKYTEMWKIRNHSLPTMISGNVTKMLLQDGS